jgi:hypothetical protein
MILNNSNSNPVLEVTNRWRAGLPIAVFCATSLMTLVTRASTQSPGSLAAMTGARPAAAFFSGGPATSESAILDSEEAASNFPNTHDDTQDITPERSRQSDVNTPPLIRLAVKYVVYQDASGNPVISKKTARKVTDGINQLYKSCNIEFVPEKFEPVQPQKIGLEFNTQSMNELDPIRAQFAEASRLVVINTGDWNHNSMGSANAWTAMPGSIPAGAIIEANAASFAGIVAHELGHYLSLDHINESVNVMNPVIYESSSRFETWQCEEMRKSAYDHWRSMMR